ncbi:dolichyl-diphosphooligosaccharide--protein glycosyltransferase subunit 1a [Quercus suber]|uniref:Dolichyl-diphosphooligosaccharide--protein glycosyltransferase subunit 1 n=1 Tax=Quercus suber TaxID=58331 RepID=A0AAW0MDH8_QUESU
MSSPLALYVVLPEGSTDISVSVPFTVKQWQETKFSHLDVIGRPVIVLEKTNAVPEHNQHFQKNMLKLKNVFSSSLSSSLVLEWSWIGDFVGGRLHCVIFAAVASAECLMA